MKYQTISRTNPCDHILGWQRAHVQRFIPKIRKCIRRRIRQGMHFLLTITRFGLISAHFCVSILVCAVSFVVSFSEADYAKAGNIGTGSSSLAERFIRIIGVFASDALFSMLRSASCIPKSDYTFVCVGIISFHLSSFFQIAPYGLQNSCGKKCG